MYFSDSTQSLTGTYKLIYINVNACSRLKEYLQSVSPGVVPSPLCLLVVVDKKAGVEDEEAILEPLDCLPLLVQEPPLDGFGHIKAKLAGCTTAASLGAAARHCIARTATFECTDSAECNFKGISRACVHSCKLMNLLRYIEYYSACRETAATVEAHSTYIGLSLHHLDWTCKGLILKRGDSAGCEIGSRITGSQPLHGCRQVFKFG